MSGIKLFRGSNTFLFLAWVFPPQKAESETPRISVIDCFVSQSHMEKKIFFLKIAPRWTINEKQVAD